MDISGLMPGPTVVEFAPRVKVFLECDNLPEGVDPTWTNSVGEELEIRINRYLETEEGKKLVSDFLDKTFEGVDHSPLEMKDPTEDEDPGGAPI